MTTLDAYPERTAPAYPVAVDIDGPQPQNRLTVFFRLILVIPHLLVLSILGIVVGLIFFISWFAILFTGTYPVGMLRFTIGVGHWYTRVNGYMWLLTDRYPAFAMGPDDAYPIRLYVEERVENRNRLTTFWIIRYILAIPHFLILGVLGYVAYIIGFIAWVVALITGSVPNGMHNFLAGYVRWYARAYAYMFNLVDEYPPFSMN